MKYFETKKDSLEEAISKAINEKPDSSNELKEVRVKNYKNEPNFFVNDKKDTLDKVSKRDGYGETDLAQYLGQKTGKDPEEIYFDGNDLVYGAKTIMRNARKQSVDKLLAKVKTVRNEYEPNIKESKMGAFFLDMQIDANEMSERDFIKKYKGEMGMTARELKDLYREMTESFSKMNAKDLEEKAGKYLRYSDLLLQKGRLMAKNKNTMMIDREIEKEKRKLGIKDSFDAKLDEMVQENDEYEKFFNAALKKFGVKSPAELKTTEKKKEFFNYVDKNYKAKNEELDKDDEKTVQKIADKLKNASKKHAKQAKSLEKDLQDNVDKTLDKIRESNVEKSKSMRSILADIWKVNEGKNPFEKDEGFASDAQRRAAFASGYKEKGKKKKEEIEKSKKTMTDKKPTKVEIEPEVK
jgi:hypothetical protein